MLKGYKLIGIWGVLMLCALIFIPLASGEEDTESGTWTYFQETYSPRLDINLRGSHFYKESNLKPDNAHLSGDATIRLSKELSSNLMFQMDPRINFDTINTEGVELFVEDQEERPALTLNEVYLSWYGDSIEVEAGKRVYSWKVADGYSPLDILNPVDIIELMDPEKIGVPSLSVLKMFDPVNVQMVFLPYFVPDRQPDDNNRWTSDDPAGRADFRDKFGMDPVNVDMGRELPDGVSDEASFASRISTSTLLSGWDLAFVYKYGKNTRGVIRNDINLFTLPVVRQTTEYPSYDLYGFSFSTVSGDIEYHGEAALHDSRDNFKDEDYLSYIVGVNYTNYDLFSDWFSEIRFVAEYAGEDIKQERDEGSNYSDKGVSRGLTSNIIGSIEFKINEDHSVKTSYMYNGKDEDSMLDLYVESQLNDYLEISYGYQNLRGDEGSFFGQWDRNDRFFLRMAIKY